MLRRIDLYISVYTYINLIIEQSRPHRPLPREIPRVTRKRYFRMIQHTVPE